MTPPIFKLALYVSKLPAMQKAYTARHEVLGAGYRAGGQVIDPASDDPVVWPAATLLARSGLIYDSAHLNRAAFVLDFGQPYSCTRSRFFVHLPKATRAALQKVIPR